MGQESPARIMKNTTKGLGFRVNIYIYGLYRIMEKNMETTMIGYILPINCNSLLGCLMKYGYIGGSYIGVYKDIKGSGLRTAD